jgi:hypothetical protein
MVYIFIFPPPPQVWKFNGDDKELVTEDRDERFPWPTKDTFSVQLFSPVSWEPISGTRMQLNDWERVTGLKHLFLSSEGLHTGQKGYIVCRYGIFFKLLTLDLPSKSFVDLF